MSDQSATPRGHLDGQHEHDPLIPREVGEVVVNSIEKPDLEIKLGEEVGVERKGIPPIFLHGLLFFGSAVAHIQRQPIIQKHEHHFSDVQVREHAVGVLVGEHMDDSKESGGEGGKVLEPLKLNHDLLA